MVHYPTSTVMEMINDGQGQGGDHAIDNMTQALVEALANIALAPVRKFIQVHVANTDSFLWFEYYDTTTVEELKHYYEQFGKCLNFGVHEASSNHTSVKELKHYYEQFGECINCGVYEASTNHTNIEELKHYYEQFGKCLNFGVHDASTNYTKV